MKTIYLTLIFSCFVYLTGYGQLVVNDPMNYGALSEMIVSAEQQLAKVDEQIAFAQKAAERVEKINNAITGLQMVRECFERGEQTIDRVNRVFSTIKEMDGFSPRYIEMCSRRCTQACKQVISNMLFMEKTLGVGFKMTDKERLESLQENLEAINKEAMAMERLEREAKRLYDKRRLLKIF